jgi:hypothetical protein
MKKTLAGLAVVIALAMGMAVPALAQYSGRINVSVPFSFTVENQRLQSGDYIVEKTAGGRLHIYTKDGRVSTTVLAIAAEGTTAPEKAHFVFRRYGDQYFLAKIWTPGLNRGWELLQGKMEVELAKRKTVPVETATLIGR